MSLCGIGVVHSGFVGYNILLFVVLLIATLWF